MNLLLKKHWNILQWGEVRVSAGVWWTNIRNTDMFTEKYRYVYREIKICLQRNTDMFTEKYRYVYREIQICLQRNTDMFTAIKG